MRSVLFMALVLATFVMNPSEERPLSYLNKNKCPELPPPVLSGILGPAFNSRYMSIEQPAAMEEEPLDESISDGGKRDASRAPYPSFYVNEDHQTEFNSHPAWSINHVRDTGADQMLRKGLSKRSVLEAMVNEIADRARPPRSPQRGRGSRGRAGSGGGGGGGSARPWDCEGRIRWIDLGPDYFPRYLRTVECTRKRCWYGHYECKPRSFTVKILRRWHGQCVPRADLRAVGVSDFLPGDLRELWIWEERAVNFCCDCAAS